MDEDTSAPQSLSPQSVKEDTTEMDCDPPSPKRSPVTPARGKARNDEYAQELDRDATSRFDYLLKQTELFSHFVSSTGEQLFFFFIL